MYRIGELSTLCSIKVPTIRYYEQVGLLNQPGRNEGNQRLYSQDDFKRLRFIKRGRELGFTQAELKVMLSFHSEDSLHCEDIYSLTKKHIEMIQEKIRDLKKIESTLRKLSKSCSQDKQNSCHIIDSLYAEIAFS